MQMCQIHADCFSQQKNPPSFLKQLHYSKTLSSTPVLCSEYTIKYIDSQLYIDPIDVMNN